MDAQLFDRLLLQRRLARSVDRFAKAGFLADEVGERLIERLAGVRRDFGTALVLGDRSGRAGDLLKRRGVETLIRGDLAVFTGAARADARIVCDEEFLPFAHGRLDLVVSSMSLHAVNDLPGALVQIRKALRPDGLFLAALPGGRTLMELRHALMQAEIELTGGVTPRVAPTMDVRDGGNLLQRAGFALPVADSEIVDVTYGDAFALMRDLRAMGETNILSERSRRPMTRALLMRAAEIYAETFVDERGRLPATFEILFLSGWHPDESQQQPARRGSGQVRLAEAFGVPLEVLEGRAKRDPER